MTVIYDSDNQKSSFIEEIKEIFYYRFFLSNLISRDLAVRYKRTALGFIWSFLNPLLMMAVLTLAFTNIYGRTEDRATYILAGIIVFGMFNKGVSDAMGSIVLNSNVLTNIYVPSSIFVLSSIISEFVDYFFSILVLLIMSLILGIKISLAWFFIIPISIFLLIFTLGVGLLLSSFAVFFMDLRSIWQIVMRAFYFITPVMFTVDLYPKLIRDFQKFNPISIYMTMFRSAFYGNVIGSKEMFIMGAIALSTFAIGWVVFNKLSYRFPYYI